MYYQGFICFIFKLGYPKLDIDVCFADTKIEHHFWDALFYFDGTLLLDGCFDLLKQTYKQADDTKVMWE